MATEAHHIPDWEAGPLTYPVTKKLTIIAGLIAPLMVVAVIATLLAGGSVVTVLAIVVFWSLIVASQWWMIERRMLRRVAAHELDNPRFDNIIEGLANKLGVAKPRLLVTDQDGPNAFVMRRKGPVVVVTRSLLDTFTRTELEAVAAHCLVRLHSGHLFFAHLAALLGRTGSRFAPQVGYSDDVHAAALTRYPPGLARAIEKAKPVEDSSEALWFVAHGPSHRHPLERIAALQDL